MKNILFYILLFYSFIAKSQNTEYSKFIGKPVNIVYSAQIYEPKIYAYATEQAKITNILLDNIPEKSIPENENIFSKEKNIENKKEKDYLFLISNLNFYYQGKKVYIIKYKTFQKGELSNVKIVMTHMLNNKWLVFQDTYLDSIQKVVKVLSLDIFLEFYNIENSSKYPEINKLKPLIRDTDGTINIFKLEGVIEKNRKELAKYLEE